MRDDDPGIRESKNSRIQEEGRAFILGFLGFLDSWIPPSVSS
jgi:hypothetical protein